MIEMIATATIRRLPTNANTAASRIARLSCRPTNVIAPAIQSTGALSALNAVKIAPETATPKDAPSEEANLKMPEPATAWTAGVFASPATVDGVAVEAD